MLRFLKELKGRAVTLIQKIRPGVRQLRRVLMHHRIAVTLLSSLLIMAMLMSVMTVTIHEIKVFDAGKQVAAYHSIFTDRDAILEKANVTLGADDQCFLSEDQGVITCAVIRAFPVTIEADGEQITVMMTKGTVGDALAKAEISYQEQDILSEKTHTAVFSGMKITLDRVEVRTVEKIIEIDYTTKKISTNDLYVGQSRTVQKGENGSKTNIYSVTYINGKEVSRELISSEITKEAVEKIVETGAKYKSDFKKTSSTPSKYKKVIAMEATAYVAGGYTASGRPAEWGVVAVDPKVIPLGTKVYVETADGQYIYGTAIAADTGGAIKGNKIDICVNSSAQARQFGRRIVNVYIL